MGPPSGAVEAGLAAVAVALGLMWLGFGLTGLIPLLRGDPVARWALAFPMVVRSYNASSRTLLRPSRVTWHSPCSRARSSQWPAPRARGGDAENIGRMVAFCGVVAGIAYVRGRGALPLAAVADALLSVAALTHLVPALIGCLMLPLYMLRLISSIEGFSGGSPSAPAPWLQCSASPTLVSLSWLEAI